MNRTLWPLLVLAAAMLGGCNTPCVHPAFADERKIQEPRIVGAWTGTGADDKTVYRVSGSADGYVMAMQTGDAKDELRFDVSFAQLGTHRFVDATPVREQREGVEHQ